MKTQIIAVLTLALAAAACGGEKDAASKGANAKPADQKTETAAAQPPSPQNQNANQNQNQAANNDAMTGHDHHTTMTTQPNAANQPYDLQFLDTMIAHHEGAVVMAKAVNSSTKNDQLRTLAANVINSQNKEIAQMREWRNQWFKDAPLALNMQMPGMADSMKDMKMDELATKRDAAFDRAFVEMMIPHHKGAVVMAQDALQRAEHPEIKTLSQQIIQAQEAEIEQMRRMLEKSN